MLNHTHHILSFETKLHFMLLLQNIFVTEQLMLSGRIGAVTPIPFKGKYYRVRSKLDLLIM